MGQNTKKCQKPENLEESPEECSAEQIRQCHGTVEQHPCTDKERRTGCEQPEKLQGQPEECSSEQIRKCHGEGSGHSCEQA